MPALSKRVKQVWYSYECIVGFSYVLLKGIVVYKSWRILTWLRNTHHYFPLLQLHRVRFRLQTIPIRCHFLKSSWTDAFLNTNGAPGIPWVCMSICHPNGGVFQ